MYDQPPESPRVEAEVINHDKTQRQKAWQLPELVLPDGSYGQSDMDTEEVEENICNQSDAVLYRVKEKGKDESVKYHSILKMMSVIPDSVLPKESNQLTSHAGNTFNLFMGDVSASMSGFWTPVVNGWNTHICPKLIGRTTIMTFGDDVKTKRSGHTNDCYKIDKTDFDGTGTDLTGAIQTVIEEVYKCKEKFINVFFVTDGRHNQSQCKPNNAIEKIRVPEGKICHVYVLGAGNDFPVQYSLNIHSRLHNGCANLPTIFWAKKEPNEHSNDMKQQMKDIANYLSQCRMSEKIKLSIPGTVLPFLSSQDSFHLNEYVYIDKAPEEVQYISFKIGKYRFKMHLHPKNGNVNLYMNHVFRQWNGILIKMNSKKENIPSEINNFMGNIFNLVLNEIKSNPGRCIDSRLASSKLKGYEVEFQTLMNKIKCILDHEPYYNEIELAKNILSTAVTTKKYGETLCKKGHTTVEYDKDMKIFKKAIEQEQSNIRQITVEDEDCCRVTLSSTILDMKDENFNRLLEMDKYNFLKTFTMSGIPIFSPPRHCGLINPWTYSVRRILKAPYTIVSQVALEKKSTDCPDSVDEENKSITLQANDEGTSFNAVIPVFPPNVASQMKNIMKTNIYAMCCTFAILKNPHIIDRNVHMAALGIVWVRTLYENPNHPRPEYVQYRLKCIEATAKQYTERNSFRKYRDLLRNSPTQALMMENQDKNDGSISKCESLVKTMFILYMAVQAKQIVDNVKIKNIVETILIEYIGRCYSNNVKQDNVSEKLKKYSDFFTKSLTDPDSKIMDEETYVEETREKLSGNVINLLEVFYYKEQCRKAARAAARDVINRHKFKLMTNIQLELNIEKVKQLRNVSTCGDVSWTTMKTFAKEVGLEESVVGDLFSEEKIFLYVAHSLRYPNSKERLENSLPDYNKCFDEIKIKVQEETSKRIYRNLTEKLVSDMINSWQRSYDEAHMKVVEPMTKSQIIQEALLKEINVNEDNFDQTYKRYRPQVGLLGNACQSPSCPWFLQPKNTFSAHISTDRCSDAFPHSLHITTKCHCRDDIRIIKNKIIAGKCRAKESDKVTTHERIAKLEISNLKNAYMQSPIQACKKCNNEMFY